MKSKLKQSSNKTLSFINYPNFQVNTREQEDSSMNWSADNPHTLPTPHVPPLEHVLLPRVPSSEHVLLPRVPPSEHMLSPRVPLP